MAGQKSDKGKAQKNAGGGMMGMVSKCLAVTAIMLGALLFAAMFDVAQLGLMDIVKGMAIALVPMFAVVAIAALFLAPKSGADAEAIAQAVQIAALCEFQSKATSQILSLQNTIDSLSGQDNETLKARNKELQEALDAIHQAERDKVDGEIETLRQRNEELEAQIKKWAFDAVGKTMSGAQAQPMKAA